MRFRLSLIFSLLLLTPAFAQSGDEAFALKDGDHVVLLGNALIEHDRFHGVIEGALRRHHPRVKFTVRNLGWSGDTVRGEARTSGYQNPEGLPRLIKEVKAQKPTVLILGYGMNESFAGKDAIEPFLKAYEKLLKDLDLPKARIVILSPTWHEDLPPPLPDPSAHNIVLDHYALALQKFADTNKYRFVDLFHSLRKMKFKEPFTTNGILLNDLGYWHVGYALEKGLGFDAGPRVAFKVDAQGKLEPVVLAPRPQPSRMGVPREMPLIIEGLPPGRHTLSLEGTKLGAADSGDWRKGVVVSAPPFLADAEALRQATIVRNDLFYRGWRPYNDHSRHWGFMAKDFKTFDDLAARQDDAIDALRLGRAASLEIAPEKK